MPTARARCTPSQQATIPRSTQMQSSGSTTCGLNVTMGMTMSRKVPNLSRHCKTSSSARLKQERMTSRLPHLMLHGLARNR